VSVEDEVEPGGGLHAFKAAMADRTKQHLRASILTGGGVVVGATLVSFGLVDVWVRLGLAAASMGLVPAMWMRSRTVKRTAARRAGAIASSTLPDDDLPASVYRRQPFLSALRTWYESAQASGDPFVLLLLSIVPRHRDDHLVVLDPALRFVVAKHLLRTSRDGDRVGSLGALDFAIALRGIDPGEARNLAHKLRSGVLDEVHSELSQDVRGRLRSRSVVVGSGDPRESFEAFYERANRVLIDEVEASSRTRSMPPAPPLPAEVAPDWLATLRDLMASPDASVAETLVVNRVRSNLAFLEVMRLNPRVSRLDRKSVYTQMDCFAQSVAFDPAPTFDGDARSEMIREIQDLTASGDRSDVEEVALQRIRAAVEFLRSTEGRAQGSRAELELLLDSYVLGAVAGGG